MMAGADKLSQGRALQNRVKHKNVQRVNRVKREKNSQQLAAKKVGMDGSSHGRGYSETHNSWLPRKLGWMDHPTVEGTANLRNIVKRRKTTWHAGVRSP
jgi:hypothetical protein